MIRLDAVIKIVYVFYQPLTGKRLPAALSLCIPSSRHIKKAPPINQRSLSYLNPPWRNDQQTIASDLSILIAQDGISTSFPDASGRGC